MRRISASIGTALLALGLIAPGASAAPATHAPVPRVVFIVGPAGAATAGYRSEARAAAAIARRYTPDVIELYSPDATWPAVKQALDGASLVVYMGHGNGWPSRYRKELYPISEDGFGLNPAPGGDDSTHQYFGEAAIGSQVKLAKNAVVVLNHLCYASGNSEPGLVEGTLDQAKQRVDNYAAGFIRAGASAVIAEAWTSPSYFVRTILAGGRSIQSAWLASPSANDNRLAFESKRSPGYVAEMDPESTTSGFTRSVVMKRGLASRDVLAGARGSSAAASILPNPVPVEPTLTSTGIALATPDITDLTSASATVRLKLPYKIGNKKALPKGIQVSIRWDPLESAFVPVQPTTEAGGTVIAPAPGASPAASPATSPGPASEPAPGPSAEPPTDVVPLFGGGSADPAATPEPSTDPSAAPSPSILPDVDAPPVGMDLVVPERTGDVVSPASVKVGKTFMAVPVVLPAQPGRYRLSITLHDPDGVAYDAATQALLPSLIVRVTGQFDGDIVAAPTAELAAGGTVALHVRARNLGLAAWGHEAVFHRPRRGTPATAATVIGRWISLSGTTDPTVGNGLVAPDVLAPLPPGLLPGRTAEASLVLTVPSAPGQYLLVLDIVTPEGNSLIASGADPTLVRVTVVPAP